MDVSNKEESSTPGTPTGGIEKQDAISGKELPDTTFGLYNSKEQLIESGTNNARGLWTPKNITEPGIYTVILKYYPL